MGRAICILALSAGLSILTMALCIHSGQPYHEKNFDVLRIDPSLLEKLSSEENDIPFIMMFSGSQMPADEDLGAAGLSVRHRYRIINGAAAVGSAQAIWDLAERQWIEGLFSDGSVHAAGPVREDGGLGASPARAVNASALWSLGINGSGVTVAILDSGIDRNHPDLIGKVVGEVNFIEDEETTSDLLGHGTMCAGIIAGSGRASGGRYRGIAPGASLLNVRVIDSDGDGQDSDIIAGIEWALNNGADVISLSLGGLDLGETDLPVTTAADNAMDAGAVICVAAGNSG